jgi:transcriptional regulator with XRE-family HTH domain
MYKETPSTAFNVIVGIRIGKCIQAAGFRTDEEFAQHCGIPKSTLSEILSGKKGARLVTFAKIAAGLGMSISELADAKEISSWIASQSKKQAKRKA